MLVRSRTIITSNFNAYGSMLNSFNLVRLRAETLEELIEMYDWLLNNDTIVATWQTNGISKSVIDLTFSTVEMSSLDMWCIDVLVTTPSHHEVILFELLDERPTEAADQITGCAISDMTQKGLQSVVSTWTTAASQQSILSNVFSVTKIEE